MSDWTPDLSRLQAFDDGEWFEVERHFTGRLLAYVSRKVADEAAREDVVQECFLGAVRGIGSFDFRYTFEQYLFGICRNRTIDHLRRRRAATMSSPAEGDASLIDQMAQDEQTPSGIFRSEDLEGRGRVLLADVLRDWVQETWEAGEFTRLMTVEALLAAGWRNRDTWEVVGLRDETAVAGVKFRALKRFRELANRAESDREVIAALQDETDEGARSLDIGAIWKEERVSCPARHWLARHVAGTLDDQPRRFIEFHMLTLECPWCRANHDDLSRSEALLAPLLERMQTSTARFLRSRRV